MNRRSGVARAPRSDPDGVDGNPFGERRGRTGPRRWDHDDDGTSTNALGAFVRGVMARVSAAVAPETDPDHGPRSPPGCDAGNESDR